MKETANYDHSCLHMKYENILQFTLTQHQMLWKKKKKKKPAKNRAEEEQQKSAAYLFW
jgi:hypothetical protein